ncbi:MAG: C1 family peptidase [Candidatus Thiodiazotropha taylori]
MLETSTIDERALDALPDIPDYRDRWYEPSLAALRQRLEPPDDLIILDQGLEGACTGFGLAATINRLHQTHGRDTRVSARMLYEMAKIHDEWPGENYAGSSCRGAIKGWYHMGVCRESLWPYQSDRPGNLTIKKAKDARAQTLGAYFRIRKNIVDMHSALNEVGVVYASAAVHSGWSERACRNGSIPLRKTTTGYHAFSIVGYDDKGFWVQNSWGEDWGRDGIAHWSYEDWMQNVSDAWVVQLALSTPQLYSRRHLSTGRSDRAGFLFSRGPRRDEIAGHFVHVDDGQFHEHGKYWSTLSDVKETADLVAKSDKYDHLLIYAHGGLNSVKASASRIAAMRDTFKSNRIYPFHIMYDTGLLEEIKDVVLGKDKEVERRAGGIGDWTDRILELTTRRAGRALWREMKQGAEDAFKRSTSPGTQVLKAFLGAFEKHGNHKQVHLVGHSTGAILHGHLLEALATLKFDLRIASVNLMAPACTTDLFLDKFKPWLKNGRSGIDALNIYNLTDQLEQDDHVAAIYRKSLLYLVSRAFEETVSPPESLLGMQIYSKPLQDLKPNVLKFYYSNGVASSRDRTNSTSHGGFDNDPATMNDILKAVLGTNRLVRPFTADSLDY